MIYDPPTHTGVRVMHRSAQLSNCGTYRYTLTRRWSRVGTIPRIVCWIMLNPSTADHEQDDPTVKRCIHFSRSWGYDGLVIVNIYPYRSSSPAECRRFAQWEQYGPDWYARDQIYFRNLPLVCETVADAALVMVAWGSKPWAVADSEHLVETIQEQQPINQDLQLYCLGTTKDGSPKHPMARGKHRVPDDQQPIPWPQS